MPPSPESSPDVMLYASDKLAFHLAQVLLGRKLALNLGSITDHMARVGSPS